MSHKSHLTTKGTKYALRTQTHARDCEPFETFVFCLGVLSGKKYSLLGQPPEKKYFNRPGKCQLFFQCQKLLPRQVNRKLPVGTLNTKHSFQ